MAVLNRKDYDTAIPQLGKSVNELNTNVSNLMKNKVSKSGDIINGDLIIKKDTTIAANYPAQLIFRTHQVDNDVTTNGFIRVYDDHDVYNYGTNMVIQGNGNMVIGSGESPYNVYNNYLKNSAGEVTYITSDNEINFDVACQADGNGNMPNRKRATLDTDLQFSCEQLTAGIYSPNTSQSTEYRVTAQGGAGKIYLYSQPSNNGSVGIYVNRSDGTGFSVLNVNQSSQLFLPGHYTTGNIKIRSGLNIKSANYGITADDFRSFGLVDTNYETIGNFEFKSAYSAETTGWRCLVRNWNTNSSAYTGWKGITCDVKRDGTSTTQLSTSTLNIGSSGENTTATLNGTLKTTGNLTVNNHSSAIGTVKNAYLSAAKSVPHNTGTALCSISLEAGTWLITCAVRAPANSSGMRAANVSTTSGAADRHITQAPVVSGSETTQMRFSLIFQPTATTTYYLNAYQNSGSTLTYPAGMSGYINCMRAVRIA